MNRWVVAPVIAVVLALAGCARQEPAVTTTSASILDDATPRSGGTLNRRLESDVSTLNPTLTISRSDYLVVQYLFTPLIHFDQQLKPVEGLATAWDISADGRQYTFHLNPRATFSDGQPVKASDVLFTLGRIMDPHSEAATAASNFELLDLARSRATDQHTVVLTFREPLSSQLSFFNTLFVLPEHVYGKGDFKNDFNHVAVGTGPYKLVKRVPGSEIVVQRRADYWATKPHIETVVFKVIGNDATAWNAARRGDIDETAVPSDVWAREQNAPAMKERFQFRRFYGASYNYIGWNGRNPLFNNSRTRRALTKCLDLQSIITGLYAGTARAMNGHFTPDEWAFNPAVPMIQYDLTAAKADLAGLGWLDTNGDGILDRGGKPFRFELLIMAGSAQAQSIAQIYQASLKQVGIDAVIAVVEFSVAFQRILAGNYDAYYLSWDLEADPDPFSLFHSSQIPPRGLNVVYYSSRAADRLMDLGRREFDQSKRVEIYRQLHAVLAEDQPYTWVIQPSQKWVINKRVQGVKEGRGFGLFLWYPGSFDWWLSDSPR